MEIVVLVIAGIRYHGVYFKTKELLNHGHDLQSYI